MGRSVLTCRGLQIPRFGETLSTLFVAACLSLMVVTFFLTAVGFIADSLFSQAICEIIIGFALMGVSVLVAQVSLYLTTATPWELVPVYRGRYLKGGEFVQGSIDYVRLIRDFSVSRAFLFSQILRTGCWMLTWIIGTTLWHRLDREHPWTFTESYFWTLSSRAFLWTFVLDFCLDLPFTHSKPRYFTRLHTVLDIVTLPPICWILTGWHDNIFFGYTPMTAGNYLMLLGWLRFWRLFGLSPSLHVVFPGINPTRLQLISVLFALLSITMMLAAGYFTLESTGNKDLYAFFPASVYYAVVTLSTVGYGDVHPTLNITKAFAIFAITLIVMVIPSELQLLVYLNQLPRDQIGGAPSHVEFQKFFLIVGRPTLAQVDAFIRDCASLTHTEANSKSLKVQRVVLLTPEDTSFYATCVETAYRRFRIHLCIRHGDAGVEASSLDDLVAVSAKEAKAAFIISDPAHIEEDKRAVLRCVALRKFLPPEKLILQLGGDSSARLAMAVGVRQVISFNQVKMHLLARSVTSCPGIVAMLTYLLKGGPDSQGARLHRVRVPPCLVGYSLRSVAVALTCSVNVLLLGLTEADDADQTKQQQQQQQPHTSTSNQQLALLNVSRQKLQQQQQQQQLQPILSAVPSAAYAHQTDSVPDALLSRDTVVIHTDKGPVNVLESSLTPPVSANLPTNETYNKDQPAEVSCFSNFKQWCQADQRNTDEPQSAPVIQSSTSFVNPQHIAYPTGIRKSSSLKLNKTQSVENFTNVDGNINHAVHDSKNRHQHHQPSQNINNRLSAHTRAKSRRSGHHQHQHEHQNSNTTTDNHLQNPTNTSDLEDMSLFPVTSPSPSPLKQRETVVITMASLANLLGLKSAGQTLMRSNNFAKASDLNTSHLTQNSQNGEEVLRKDSSHSPSPAGLVSAFNNATVNTSNTESQPQSSRLNTVSANAIAALNEFQNNAASSHGSRQLKNNSRGISKLQSLAGIMAAAADDPANSVVPQSGVGIREGGSTPIATPPNQSLSELPQTHNVNIPLQHTPTTTTMSPHRRSHFARSPTKGQHDDGNVPYLTMNATVRKQLQMTLLQKLRQQNNNNTLTGHLPEASNENSDVDDGNTTKIEDKAIEKDTKVKEEDDICLFLDTLDQYVEPTVLSDRKSVKSRQSRQSRRSAASSHLFGPHTQRSPRSAVPSPSPSPFCDELQPDSLNTLNDASFPITHTASRETITHNHNINSLTLVGSDMSGDNQQAPTINGVDLLVEDFDGTIKKLSRNELRRMTRMMLQQHQNLLMYQNNQTINRFRPSALQPPPSLLPVPPNPQLLDQGQPNTSPSALSLTIPQDGDEDPYNLRLTLDANSDTVKIHNNIPMHAQDGHSVQGQVGLANEHDQDRQSSYSFAQDQYYAYSGEDGEYFDEEDDDDLPDDPVVERMRRLEALLFDYEEESEDDDQESLLFSRCESDVALQNADFFDLSPQDDEDVPMDDIDLHDRDQQKQLNSANNVTHNNNSSSIHHPQQQTQLREAGAAAAALEFFKQQHVSMVPGTPPPIQLSDVNLPPMQPSDISDQHFTHEVQLPPSTVLQQGLRGSKGKTRAKTQKDAKDRDNKGKTKKSSVSSTMMMGLGRDVILKENHVLLFASHGVEAFEAMQSLQKEPLSDLTTLLSLICEHVKDNNRSSTLSNPKNNNANNTSSTGVNNVNSGNNLITAPILLQAQQQYLSSTTHFKQQQQLQQQQEHYSQSVKGIEALRLPTVAEATHNSESESLSDASSTNVLHSHPANALTAINNHNNNNHNNNNNDYRNASSSLGYSVGLNVNTAGSSFNNNINNNTSVVTNNNASTALSANNNPSNPKGSSSTFNWKKAVHHLNLSAPTPSPAPPSTTTNNINNNNNNNTLSAMFRSNVPGVTPTLTPSPMIMTGELHTAAPFSVMANADEDKEKDQKQFKLEFENFTTALPNLQFPGAPMLLICGWPRTLGVLLQCLSYEQRRGRWWNVAVLAPYVPAWSTLEFLAPFSKFAFFVRGSPLRTADLLKGGLLLAAGVLVFSSTLEGEEAVLDEAQQDVDAILVSRKVKSLKHSANSKENLVHLQQLEVFANAMQLEDEDGGLTHVPQNSGAVSVRSSSSSSSSDDFDDDYTISGNSGVRHMKANAGTRRRRQPHVNTLPVHHMHTNTQLTQNTHNLPQNVNNLSNSHQNNQHAFRCIPLCGTTMDNQTQQSSLATIKTLRASPHFPRVVDAKPRPAKDLHIMQHASQPLPVGSRLREALVSQGVVASLSFALASVTKGLAQVRKELRKQRQFHLEEHVIDQIYAKRIDKLFSCVPLALSSVSSLHIAAGRQLRPVTELRLPRNVRFLDDDGWWPAPDIAWHLDVRLAVTKQQGPMQATREQARHNVNPVDVSLLEDAPAFSAGRVFADVALYHLATCSSLVSPYTFGLRAFCALMGTEDSTDDPHQGRLELWPFSALLRVPMTAAQLRLVSALQRRAYVLQHKETDLGLKGLWHSMKSLVVDLPQEDEGNITQHYLQKSLSQTKRQEQKYERLTMNFSPKDIPQHFDCDDSGDCAALHIVDEEEEEEQDDHFHQSNHTSSQPSQRRNEEVDDVFSPPKRRDDDANELHAGCYYENGPSSPLLTKKRNYDNNDNRKESGQVSFNTEDDNFVDSSKKPHKTTRFQFSQSQDQFGGESAHNGIINQTQPSQQRRYSNTSTRCSNDTLMSNASVDPEIGEGRVRAGESLCTLLDVCFGAEANRKLQHAAPDTLYEVSLAGLTYDAVTWILYWVIGAPPLGVLQQDNTVRVTPPGNYILKPNDRLYAVASGVQTARLLAHLGREEAVVSSIALALDKHKDNIRVAFGESLETNLNPISSMPGHSRQSAH